MKQSYYHVICRNGCPYCSMAVELLEQNNLHFHADYFGSKQQEQLDEQKKRYDWWTVPIVNKVEVAEDGTIVTEFIGGYTDLKEYLNVDKTTQDQTEEEAEEASTSST